MGAEGGSVITPYVEYYGLDGDPDKTQCSRDNCLYVALFTVHLAHDEWFSLCGPHLRELRETLRTTYSEWQNDHMMDKRRRWKEGRKKDGQK